MNQIDVLAELRAWRDEFARSHGYDLHAMAAMLRELDKAGERKIVHGEPRRPAQATAQKQTPPATEAAVSKPASSESPDAGSEG